MKRTDAANEPAMRGSLGCALPGVELDIQNGMPRARQAVSHLRPLYRSNLYFSRGSAVV